MKVILNNVTAILNGGDGVRVGSAVSELHITGHLNVSENKGVGLNLAPEPVTIQKLGFPSDVDAEKVRSLLQELLNTQPEQRVQVIQNSRFTSDLLGMGADISTITSNVLEIFSMSDPAAFIASLFQG